MPSVMLCAYDLAGSPHTHSNVSAVNGKQLRMHGGFPALKHNNITAKCLSEVCHNVAVEPELFSGERLQPIQKIVQGLGSGGRGINMHLDVRVFNPNAPSNCKSTQTAVRKENRRSYQQQILEVKHGSFTPLVFSATGGMVPAACVTYK